MSHLWSFPSQSVLAIGFLDQAPLPGRRQELRELKSSFQLKYLWIILVAVTMMMVMVDLLYLLFVFNVVDDGAETFWRMCLEQ